MKHYYKIDENNIAVEGLFTLEDGVTPPADYKESVPQYETYPALGTLWDVAGNQWNIPVPTPETRRAQRDEELAISDWTQMPDSPLSASDKEEWRVYRQALRDSMEGYDGTTFVPRLIRPDRAQ